MTNGSVALPFVIPSAAEGSAVLRTIPGNVFSTERSNLRFPADHCPKACAIARSARGAITAYPFAVG